jgi:hypothetical protein
MNRAEEPWRETHGRDGKANQETSTKNREHPSHKLRNKPRKQLILGKEDPSGNLPVRKQIRRQKIKPAPGVAHRSSRGKIDPGRAERKGPVSRSELLGLRTMKSSWCQLSGSRRPTGRTRPGGVLLGLRTMKSRSLAA